MKKILFSNEGFSKCENPVSKILTVLIYQYDSTSIYLYQCGFELSWIQVSSPASSVEWLFLSCLFCHSGLSSHPTCVIPPFWAFYHPAHIHLQSLTFPRFEHQTRACLPSYQLFYFNFLHLWEKPWTRFKWLFHWDIWKIQNSLSNILAQNFLRLVLDEIVKGLCQTST